MQTPSIKTIILRITLVIALAELAIMLLLGGIAHDLSSPLEALLDTLILITFSTPVIYVWVIKPYVIARDEAVAKVTYMAFHDPLTQLANRRLLSEYLDKIISRFDRHKVYGALLLIDLDGFKPINDNCGHDIGDAILIEIAIRLQASVRGEDIAGRLGGDEFVILLNQLDTDKQIAEDMALQIAKRIQDAIQQSIELNETFQLSASIGMRMLGDEKAVVDTIIKEADVAMYRAKKAGKGRTIVFE